MSQQSSKFGEAIENTRLLSSPNDAAASYVHTSLSKAEDLDTVQFTSAMYFVESTEGSLKVDIMRIGSLIGDVSFDYFTEDSSAKKSKQYTETKGRRTMFHGQASISLDIPVLNCPAWRATLEFKVRLAGAVGCSLGLYLHTCRVKVMDRSLFPSSEFGERIACKQGVETIPDRALFLAFVRLILHKRGIFFRVTIILIFDQLPNLYMLSNLLLKIYLVDVVFATQNKDSEEKMIFFPGKRVEEATTVAFLMFLPMCFIHLWDYLKANLETVSHVRLFLQTSLFRKYLNYSVESRDQVPLSSLGAAINKFVPQVAEGFELVLQFSQYALKLAILFYFMITKDRAAVWAVFVMPGCMAAFAVYRSAALAKASKRAAGPQLAFEDFMTETCSKYELVSDYFQRPTANAVFAQKCERLNDSKLIGELVRLNNMYFAEYLGPFFTLLYTPFAAMEVLEGRLSLGTMLATMALLASLSRDVSVVYEYSMKLTTTLTTLRILTPLYNLETELPSWKRVNRERRRTTFEKIAQVTSKKEKDFEVQEIPAVDKVDICMENMCYQYQRSTELLFQNVNLSCPQGSIVAVVGPQGSGRATFLRLLAHQFFPTSGSIFIPSHLRILRVSMQVYLLQDTILENVTFGSQRPTDFKRVQSILERLQMPSAVEMFKEEVKACVESSMEEHGLGEPADPSGLGGDSDRLSWTEKAKVHLARAFVMNPEVMLLHRPFSHHDSADDRTIIWHMIMEHVSNRGVAFPKETAYRRRPRTVFFIAEDESQAARADFVWQISSDSRTITPYNLETIQSANSNGGIRSSDQSRQAELARVFKMKSAVTKAYSQLEDLRSQLQDEKLRVAQRSRDLDAEAERAKQSRPPTDSKGYEQSVVG